MRSSFDHWYFLPARGPPFLVASSVAPPWVFLFLSFPISVLTERHFPASTSEPMPFFVPVFFQISFPVDPPAPGRTIHSAVPFTQPVMVCCLFKLYFVPRFLFFFFAPSLAFSNPLSRAPFSPPAAYPSFLSVPISGNSSNPKRLSHVVGPPTLLQSPLVDPLFLTLQSDFVCDYLFLSPSWALLLRRFLVSLHSSPFARMFCPKPCFFFFFLAGVAFRLSQVTPFLFFFGRLFSRSTGFVAIFMIFPPPLLALHGTLL